MSHAYNSGGEEVAASYRRVHANGEQTHVHVVSAGESSYVAVAVDIDPREYQAVAAEAVAYDPTLEGVTARVERWMEANPKGVAGGGSGSSGLLGRLLGLLGRVDEYGNSLAEQQQQEAENE